MKTKKADWEIAIEAVAIQQAKTEKVIERLSIQQANNDEIIKASREEIKASREEVKANREEIKEAVRIAKGQGHSMGIVAETAINRMTRDGLTLDIEDKKIFFEQHKTGFYIKDENGKFVAEIDVFMTNCDYVLLIETKYRLDKKQMSQMDDILEKLAKYPPKEIKGKKILTAFASLGVDEATKEKFTENNHIVITKRDLNLDITYPNAL